jgi:hypothetical protein
VTTDDLPPVAVLMAYVEYEVIAAPPVFDGAVKLTDKLVLVIGATVVIVGASGARRPLNESDKIAA